MDHLALEMCRHRGLPRTGKLAERYRLGGSYLSEGAKRDSDLQVLLLDYLGEEACEMTEHPQTGGTQSR